MGIRLVKIIFENKFVPAPKEKDLMDAIEMVKESYPEEVEDKTLKDFDLEYVGLLDVKDIGDYADFSSWLEDIEDEEEMRRFRGDKWFERMEDYNKKGMIPPIVVVEGRGFVDVGDGRGRVTYARWKGIPLHVYKLKLRETNGLPIT